MEFMKHGCDLYEKHVWDISSGVSQVQSKTSKMFSF